MFIFVFFNLDAPKSTAPHKIYSNSHSMSKKVIFKSTELVNFPVQLVDSICYLSKGQVKFPGIIFEEIQIID